MITYANATPGLAERRFGTPTMGKDFPCHSGVCPRDEWARQAVLRILYPAKREPWRSTPGDTTFFAPAVASITGDTPSARGETDQVSTQNTLAEGTRRSHHVLQWLEFMRSAICQAASVIIGGHRGRPLNSFLFIATLFIGMVNSWRS